MERFNGKCSYPYIRDIQVRILVVTKSCNPESSFSDVDLTLSSIRNDKGNHLFVPFDRLFKFDPDILSFPEKRLPSMFVSIARLVAVLKQCRGENLEDRLMELKRAANLSAVTEKIIVVNLIKHLLVPLFGHVDLEKGYGSLVEQVGMLGADVTITDLGVGGVHTWHGSTEVRVKGCPAIVIAQGVHKERSVLSCTPPAHLASSHVDAPTTGSPTAAWAGLVTKRTLRVEANFDELLGDYFKTKLPAVGEQPEGEESLEHFCDGLQKFTQFNSFRELATLTYGEKTNNCCIVSSLEFDHDGEFFAVAGVTKKIKVFEYQSVVRNAGFTNHFPVHEMSCAARLSCVAYNPYHKQQLVSSDYEGCVCVWDTSLGRRTALQQEHGQRVWSVAYNPQEPTLFASGSDDCTVKLWSMGKATSILSLSARANICSVKFNPHSRHMLAYGSLDHGVHYVDLRKPTQPVMEFLGHKKAVSYVNFMSSSEIVSAREPTIREPGKTYHKVSVRTSF